MAMSRADRLVVSALAICAGVALSAAVSVASAPPATRQTPSAAAMYEAGAGDPAALPAQSIPALGPRLVRARVVRARAAEALVGLGVVTLDGPAGAALALAEDDYAASLRTFPHVAGDHASLGWLDLPRGRADEAAREPDTAVRLDAADPRPLVYRGVLAARDGRYAEAIKAWRQAKALDPGYPNIDWLIAEAEKRLRAPGP